MTATFIDSDRRCPYDGKRMVVDIGQRDDDGGETLRAVHTCLACDYTETEEQWSMTTPAQPEPRPRRSSADRTSASRRRAGSRRNKRLRNVRSFKSDAREIRANRPQAGDTPCP